MPKTIQLIISGLTAVIAGWAPTTSLLNDIADGILLLTEAHSALPGNALITAVLKTVNKTSAGILNIASGQAAYVGSEVVSFPGYGDDEVVVFAFRKYNKGGAPEGSPAATFKAALGI